MRKVLILVAASIVSSACWGQTPEMGPPTELKAFDWLVGSWTADKSSFSLPDMGPMEVTSTLTAVWDGQFLKQTSVMDFGVMSMTETMMFGYDPDKKEYFSHAFTNMAPLPRIEHGKMENGSLVMVSDPWDVMGGDTVSRGTVTKIDDDTFKLKIEFKVDDSWVVANESTFHRKKESPSAR
ncbi:MAG TPA: DUF1579 family protein [Fimbriimonadaceae bacterium]|nr:DUF1579 family protein [Fimbriimonadaceae bacterium]